MGQYTVQILETLIVFSVIFAVKLLFRKSIRRMAHTFSMHMNVERKNMIGRTINISLSLLAVVALVAIWSIDSQQLFFFISSLLTALGIAFFAQWSILSNITASLILFFNHPLKIGGRVRVIDKDYPIEGTLEKISLIFMHIRLDNGENITIPNNIVLQKMIAVLDDKNQG
jgi:small-conductance mechanosensitive channel